MGVIAKNTSEARWVREFGQPASFDDDLGTLGAWVGPRTGHDRRDKGQKEDYVLRRFLVALKRSNRLRFPLKIEATRDEPNQPDFTIAWPDGFTMGVEVTEATTPEWQAELTRSEEREARGPLLTESASAPDISELIAKRIAQKGKKFDEGAYRGTDDCVLIIYENAEFGGFRDKSADLNRLRKASIALTGFSAVHFVAAERVWLDILGSQELVDVSKSYEIDFANWIADQVEKIRLQGDEGLDLSNISEELEALGRRDRRALKSHLRNLLVHLLKWQYQPQRRSDSWLRSIGNARAEIEDILSDSPSLKSFLEEQIDAEFEKARAQAIRETGLGSNSLPDDCPYKVAALVDDDFLPE